MKKILFFLLLFPSLLFAQNNDATLKAYVNSNIVRKLYQEGVRSTLDLNFIKSKTSTYDNVFHFRNSSDTTKKAQFSLSGITTGNTRTFTFPDNSGLLMLMGAANSASGNTTTTIQSSGNIGSNNYRIYGQQIAGTASNVTLQTGLNDTFTKQAQVQVSSSGTTNSISLLYQDNSSNTNSISMTSGTPGFLFTDVINSKGILYAADYSANYGTQSVPDVSYVDGHISTQSGTTYTLAATDRNSWIFFTSASNVTVTLPNGLTAGFKCTLVKYAAGNIILSATGTLNSDGTTVSVINTGVTVHNKGSNVWTAVGSLGTALSANNGITLNTGNFQLGGTLNQNTTIAEAGFNTTFTGTGTVSFSPTTTQSGVNVGSFSGVPSTLNNGDLYWNSASAPGNFTFGTSAATGNAVTLAPNGAGANYTLALTSKGNGNITLQTAGTSTGVFISPDNGTTLYSFTPSALTGSTASAFAINASGAQALNLASGTNANVSIGSAAVGSGTSGTIAISSGNNSSGASGDITLGSGTATTTKGSVNVTTPQLKTLHLQGTSTAPGIAAGTGAGTTPTVTITNGTDLSGILNITTGTTPTASAVVATITFNAAYGVAPNVSLTAANAATANLAVVSQVYITSTTTTFVVNATGTALTASTAYKWYYHVIQ